MWKEADTQNIQGCPGITTEAPAARNQSAPCLQMHKLRFLSFDKSGRIMMYGTY